MVLYIADMAGTHPTDIGNQLYLPGFTQLKNLNQLVIHICYVCIEEDAGELGIMPILCVNFFKNTVLYAYWWHLYPWIGPRKMRLNYTVHHGLLW